MHPEFSFSDLAIQEPAIREAPLPALPHTSSWCFGKVIFVEYSSDVRQAR